MRVREMGRFRLPLTNQQRGECRSSRIAFGQERQW
jgi:hypothetical protein